jgi:hypothetical protein
MERVTRTGLLAALVAAPVVASAVLWLGALATAAVTGHHPIWNLQGRNLPEAVAFRDPAAVIRLVQQGGDIDAAAEVRPVGGLHEPTVLRPIEAAGLSRQAEMVQLILDLGASLDAQTWQRAWCFAGDSGARDPLKMRRPPDADDHCVAE